MFFLTLFEDPLQYLRYVVIIVLSICLHELAHGWVALAQGDDTPRTTGHMTLNPLVHMGVPSLLFLMLVGISWGAMPVNPSQFRTPRLGNILVSAAGPMLNLSLALSAIVLISLVETHDIAWVSLEFLRLVAMINLFLFLFNLLPIPPLDGFHVCSEFFPSLKSLRYGQLGLGILVLLFFVFKFGAVLSGLSIAIMKAVLGAL